MDIATLLKKRDLFQANKGRIPKTVRDNYNASFEVSYAHNSTAIEGNTLSLLETKLLLEDSLSVGGKPLREIYEVVNHSKAFGYVKKCIMDGKNLNEAIVKDIHATLMGNIMAGGIYRDVPVRISGARHTPPDPVEAYTQIKLFYTDMPLKINMLDPISFAAWTHAEFVRIHPFVDGNGRASRLIMNYQLMAMGFLPISIAKEARLSYFEALETYALENNLWAFTEMIAGLEEEQLDLYLAAL